MAEIEKQIVGQTDKIATLVRGVEPLTDLPRSTQLFRVTAESLRLLFFLNKVGHRKDKDKVEVMKITHGSGTEAYATQPSFFIMENVPQTTEGPGVLFEERLVYGPKPNDGRHYFRWRGEYDSSFGLLALIRAKIRIAEVTLDDRLLDQAWKLFFDEAETLGTEPGSWGEELADRLFSFEPILKRMRGQAEADHRMADELAQTKLDSQKALEVVEEIYWTYK